MFNEISQKFLKIFGGVVLIAIILVLVVFFAPDRIYSQYFEILDNTVIKNSGTNEINFIVNESISTGNESQNLNKIAELITKNYDDKVVAQNYPSLPGSRHFVYDEYSRIRAIPADIELDPYAESVYQKLASDPNWLIYQKFGACRELSVIFSNIANKSGFPSRIVRTSTHWWNEIEMNNVNKTFDVQWYLQIKTNMSSGSSWSGNRSDFVKNSDGFTPKKLCSLGGVWITDEQGHKIEDITHDYMGSDNCSRENL